MEAKGRTASALARAAGVNVETLRYYERRGLLPRPRRTDRGYRLYDEETVRRLRFIQRAQTLGFSLKEIRGLLGLRVPGNRRCAEVRRRAEAKIAEVEAKARDLRRIKRALERLVASCAGRGSVGECPILDALEEGKEE